MLYYSISLRRATKPSEDLKSQSSTTETAKEKTMNSFASTLYRDVTCAGAAVLITFVLSLSFVASTSAAPFHATRAVAAEQAQRA